jgi:hypothetical protein
MGQGAIDKNLQSKILATGKIYLIYYRIYELGVNDKYCAVQWSESKVNRQRRYFINDKSTCL